MEGSPWVGPMGGRVTWTGVTWRGSCGGEPIGEGGGMNGQEASGPKILCGLSGLTAQARSWGIAVGVGHTRKAMYSQPGSTYRLRALKLKLVY